MRRSFVWILVVTLCCASYAVAPPPASAALTVEVTPSTALVEGQTVTVTVSGFPGLAAACQGVEADAGLVREVGLEVCGGPAAVAFAGEQMTFSVRRHVYSPTLGRTVDCSAPDAGCVVFDANTMDLDGTIDSRTLMWRGITFGPVPPQPIERGTFSLSSNVVPAGGLVLVWGSGFPAQRMVHVFQCAPMPEFHTQCGPAQQLTTNDDGGFGVPLFVSRYVTSEGDEIDCTHPEASCWIAVTAQVDVPASYVSTPISVPDGTPGRIVVSPDSNLVVGQEVEVTGTGWAPGSLVFVYACASGGDEVVRCDVLLGPATASAAGTIRVPVVISPKIASPPCVFGGPCAIAAAYSPGTPPGGGAAWKLIRLRRPRQPDVQIIRLTDGGLLGDDVFGVEGQARLRAVEPGTTWSYAIRVENDGFEWDDMTVAGQAGDDLVRISYFLSWFDVSALVSSGRLTFHDVPPGGSRVLSVRFEVDEATPPGIYQSDVTATSEGSRNNDVVRLGVAVK